MFLRFLPFFLATAHVHVDFIFRSFYRNTFSISFDFIFSFYFSLSVFNELSRGRTDFLKNLTFFCLCGATLEVIGCFVAICISISNKPLSSGPQKKRNPRLQVSSSLMSLFSNLLHFNASLIYARTLHDLSPGNSHKVSEKPLILKCYPQALKKRFVECALEQEPGSEPNANLILLLRDLHPLRF